MEKAVSAFTAIAVNIRMFEMGHTILASPIGILFGVMSYYSFKFISSDNKKSSRRRIYVRRLK